MINSTKFYIAGEWTDPVIASPIDVINPATEEAYVQVSLGSAADVNKAAEAARAAFTNFSRTKREYRADLLMRIAQGIKDRFDEVAQAITDEMGSPLWFSREIQTGLTIRHFTEMATVLREYRVARPGFSGEVQ
jgi:aldehyde dehydrogenase (NAD+)